MPAYPDKHTAVKSSLAGPMFAWSGANSIWKAPRDPPRDDMLAKWRTVTTGMQLLCNSRTFNIHAVLNTNERNQWMELLIEEGAAI